jgi:peptidoglycan/LPS O-acetylase OafA/YrhL
VQKKGHGLSSIGAINESVLTARTAKVRHGYLPSLDGWRAIAIISVILYHDSLHRMGPVTTLWFWRCGDRGVDLFFAISGILICSRLLDEERVTRSISLTKFYIRRFFRIIPPAFLYLTVLAIAGILKLVPSPWIDWAGAAMFFRNYLPVTSAGWYSAHFWSLSMEEHFYLVIPGLLVLITRSRLKVFGGLVLAMTAWHFFVLLKMDHTLEHVRTDTRITFLLIPAMFAIMLQSPDLRRRLTQWTRWWLIILVAAVGYITATIWLNSISGILLTSIVEPTLLSMLLLSTVLHPANLLSRFLELRFMRFIGQISYSLYLWQQLFFVNHFGTKTNLLALSALPWWVRAIATFICAYASYRLLEKPLIKLGHRLAPPATAGRNDSEENKASSRE